MFQSNSGESLLSNTGRDPGPKLSPECLHTEVFKVVGVVPSMLILLQTDLSRNSIPNALAVVTLVKVQMPLFTLVVKVSLEGTRDGRGGL